MANVRKNINYLNKDFGQLRSNLIDFTKIYFPNTFNDYTEADPGMMFIEQASYVGDVLNYYMDVNLKESIFTEAEELPNVFAHSRARGYKPKNAVPASVTLDVYQIVPSIGSGDNVRPDYNYALRINEGMVANSTSPVAFFRTVEPVDFAYSSSYSPTDVSVYQVNGQTPEYYLLKKKVNAISGQIITKTFTFGPPKQYDKIELTDENIIEVIDIYDNDGNRWYEVPYLAQETIIENVENSPRNNTEFHQHRDRTPYMMNIRKVSRRFITNVTSRNIVEIQFGAGISSELDEDIVPNPDLVGSELVDVSRIVSENIDPSNFLKTRSYGLAPANTTLTVRYTIGGGVTDNVRSNSITEIYELPTSIEDRNLDSVLLTYVRNSVRVNNPNAATGAKSKEAIDEIKNQSMAYFSTQDRMVTKEDYVIRSYAMPQRFGSVAKSYVIKDDLLNMEVNLNGLNDRVSNPYGINLYTLGYDHNGNLTKLNNATKTNLMTYLDYHRLMTDSINIKDAYIINIGVDFEIIIRPNYNGNEVLLRCIDMLKKMFDIRKWQINQPIMLNNVYTEIDKIEGVQSVVNVSIQNYWDEDLGYSGNIYDIPSSTREGIIYPSMDPSIFEVKFPNSDIKGMVKNLGI